MRTFRVHNALVSAVAGSVLALAGTAAPAHAQFFGINFNFGFGGGNPTVKPAANPPAPVAKLQMSTPSSLGRVGSPPQTLGAFSRAVIMVSSAMSICSVQVLSGPGMNFTTLGSLG